MTSLQRSVQAVLLGRTHHPDWLMQGIKKRAHTHTLCTKHIGAPDGKHSSVASDGKYLYVHCAKGLYKIGSGYSDTIKGHIYASTSDMSTSDEGWLACAAGRLFYKAGNGTISEIDTMSLKPIQILTLEGEGYGPHVMFSDGTHLGHVAAANDDSFVVRVFDPTRNPMPLLSEIPLKLARKCLDVIGASAFDNESEIHTLITGYEDDTVSITAAKEFALIRTSSGKVLYTGKSTALGIKQGGPSAGKWAELSITKSPKIVHISSGHEGQHALLTADDGSVFFAGKFYYSEKSVGMIAIIEKNCCSSMHIYSHYF